MPENDEMTKLLEDLYIAAVRRGERDDPTIMKLAAEVERRRPKEAKPQPEPEHGEAKHGGASHK